ncbi:glycine receptor subunit alpha-3 [Caerostris darwini]|uniref:Glycine receptor subunit alpha-3 n=1 Tax=Caerostris darwini TaxID=1538125 RepID=A0AAV4R9W2_9ARAC|nr:glycine receptor subunit alpha-3 [Caerostris darwini]
MVSFLRKGLPCTLGSREMVSRNSFTRSGTFILIKSQLWSVGRPAFRASLEIVPRFLDLCGEAMISKIFKKDHFLSLYWTIVERLKTQRTYLSCIKDLHDTLHFPSSARFSFPNPWCLLKNFKLDEGYLDFVSDVIYEVNDIDIFYYLNMLPIKKSIVSNFTCIEVLFTLERRLGYYLFHTYIPTCLIVIMSWISFWIRADAVPARVTLCVTSLLTLATQHAQSQKSLPPVSYIKAIDIFMSTCTLFVFSSLMEYAIVNIVVGQAEERERLANKLLNDIQLIHMEGEIRVPNGTKIARSPSLHRRSQSLERRAQKIDKFSRIVFPFLFVVLNVAYWCYYLR